MSFPFSSLYAPVPIHLPSLASSSAADPIAARPTIRQHNRVHVESFPAITIRRWFWSEDLIVLTAHRTHSGQTPPGRIGAFRVSGFTGAVTGIVAFGPDHFPRAWTDSINCPNRRPRFTSPRQIFPGNALSGLLASLRPPLSFRVSQLPASALLARDYRLISHTNSADPTPKKQLNLMLH